MRLTKPTRLDIGIFLVSFAVLVIELLLTRIFSVTLYYHLSFMVVSLAMLGFGGAGLVTNLWPQRFPADKLLPQLTKLALGFAVTTVAAVAVALSMSVSLSPSKGNLVRLAIIYSLCAVPFFLGGLIVALLMAHRVEQVNRLYFFDLLGAALGCLAFIPLTNYLGAPTAVLVGASLGALAGVCFSWRKSQLLSRVALGICLVLVVSAIGNAKWDFLEVRVAKGRQQPPTVAKEWNSFSRVEVNVLGQPPDMWAPRPPRHAGFSTKLDPTYKNPELYLRYDADAATSIIRFDGDFSKLWFLGWDVTAAPYQMRRFQNVLILGPGGGRDVLTALSLGSGPITGIEINPLTIKLMNGKFHSFTNGLYDNYPGVRVIHDEGRSFLRNPTGKYDLIQASLVDTWAASTAGAYALTENNLYTVEAFDEYLKRLTPDGLISFSRWYPEPPVEPLRVVTLAIEALQRRQINNPANHIFVVTTNPTNRRKLATILIKQSPFTTEELTKLRTWADSMDFIVSYSPDDASRGIAQNDFHQLLGPGYRQFVNDYPYDISAVYDDRPFFFDRVPLVRWLSHRLGIGRSRVGAGNLTLGVQTLLLSLIISAVFTLVLLFLPFVVGRWRSTNKENVERTSWGRRLTWAIYFAGLGLGFITVEIVMIQRLNLFLGYPVYSLSVVLFTLLIFGSLGSLVASRWKKTSLPLAIGILCCMLVAYSFLLEPFLNTFLGSSATWRILLAGGLLAPLGFLMGTPFPTGLRIAAAETKSLVSWAWAVNGGASVFGSTLSMVISMTYGFVISSLVGLAAYAIALTLLVVLLRNKQMTSTAVPAG
ncbi:MAG TPA: hypothetical protein VJU86_03895 [Pyrinomonadaceae bacterium]|nr:hypothetical protein [Pyrinomonadaceae bacterium]